MIATNLTISIHAANAAALRAVASAGLTANHRSTVLQSAGNRAIYRWESASTATDDGLSVIKPTDIAGANPGRWIIGDWVETTTEGFHSELLFSLDLGATSAATSYALLVGSGWEYSCITIEGSNRRVWFRKTTV